VQLLDPVQLAEDLRDDVLLDAGAVLLTAGGAERVELVEEDDRGGGFARLAEQRLDHVLGLADPLGHDVGNADVEERHVVLGGQRFGHQRLPAAGGTVQHDALGRGELGFLEELGLLVGELDDVAQALDDVVETADLVVADARLLAEEHLTHVRRGAHLEQLVGRREKGDLVPDLDLVTELVVPRDDLLLHPVADRDDELVADDVLDRADGALLVLGGGTDHGVGLGVKPDVLALPEVVLLDHPGRDLHHLALVSHGELVVSQVLATEAKDVSVEQGRLADLVELLLVGVDLGAQLLDLLLVLLERLLRASDLRLTRLELVQQLLELGGAVIGQILILQHPLDRPLGGFDGPDGFVEVRIVRRVVSH
jgi:hypothetical protein